MTRKTLKVITAAKSLVYFVLVAFVASKVRNFMCSRWQRSNLDITFDSYLKSEGQDAMLSFKIMLIFSAIAFIVHLILVLIYFRKLNRCSEERVAIYVGNIDVGDDMLFKRQWTTPNGEKHYTSTVEDRVKFRYPTENGEYLETAMELSKFNFFRVCNKKKEIPICYNPEKPFEVMSRQCFTGDRKYYKCALLIACILAIFSWLVVITM